MMVEGLRRSFLLFLFLISLLHCAALKAGSRLLAEGVIAATATDQSGLKGLLEDEVTPRNQIGGLGGAIAYSGHQQIFYAVPDRGPGAGETSYEERLYTLDLGLTESVEPRLQPKVVATRILTSQDGRPLTGDASAFDATNSSKARRRDQEALRVSPNGQHVFIAEEYGPFIEQFEIKSGRLVRTLPIPNKFLIDYPSRFIREELNRNLVGRQSNRGFESLAITPEGNRLLAMIQDPLLQDCDANPPKKLGGRFNRILDIDLETEEVHEWSYPLEAAHHGVSELLAVDEHRFLVLERDGQSGAEARFKKIFLIDLLGATDVHGRKSLAIEAQKQDQAEGRLLPIPVKKTLFLDLLSLPLKTVPEKFEGMAFGPPLMDGRLLLVVTTDNDFSRTEDTHFYAIAIDSQDLPGFIPQKIRQFRPRRF